MTPLEKALRDTSGTWDFLTLRCSSRSLLAAMANDLEMAARWADGDSRRNSWGDVLRHRAAQIRQALAETEPPPEGTYR